MRVEPHPTSRAATPQAEAKPERAAAKRRSKRTFLRMEQAMSKPEERMVRDASDVRVHRGVGVSIEGDGEEEVPACRSIEVVRVPIRGATIEAPEPIPAISKLSYEYEYEYVVRGCQRGQGASVRHRSSVISLSEPTSMDASPREGANHLHAFSPDPGSCLRCS